MKSKDSQCAGHTTTDRPRVIMRYANRKLYDRQESHYITLQTLVKLIRPGDELQVVDHQTGRDLTTVTLAQALFLAERRAPRVSVASLRKIIIDGWSAD